MRLVIDGREAESLTVTLTDASGRATTHAVAPDALVRALAGELGASMREVAIAAAPREPLPTRQEPVREPSVAPTGLCTVREAAEALGVCARTVYRLIEEGELPAARIRGAWRIPRARLADLAGV